MAARAGDGSQGYGSLIKISVHHGGKGEKRAKEMEWLGGKKARIRRRFSFLNSPLKLDKYVERRSVECLLYVCLFCFVSLTSALFGVVDACA